MSTTYKTITESTYPKACYVVFPPEPTFPHTHGTLLLKLIKLLNFEIDEEHVEDSLELYLDRVQDLNFHLFRSGIVYQTSNAPLRVPPPRLIVSHVYGYISSCDEFVPLIQVDVAMSGNHPHAFIRHINPNEF